jgi:hypothetical protein
VFAELGSLSRRMLSLPASSLSLDILNSCPNKTQTSKSVSAGYAHPDQRGKVIVPRNLTASHTKHAGEGVAIDLSFERLPIHDI